MLILAFLACSTPPVPVAAAPPAAPWIPPHCYARVDEPERNPCYVCHQRGRRPNSLDDSALQVTYDFPDPVRTNGWANLFSDRRAEIDAISDPEIDRWVATSNRPEHRWGAALAPDEAGWDQAGWRRYSAPPIPGFGSTHGSFGQVYIRLAPELRPDRATHGLNLAILDAVVTREDVPIPPTEEATWGVDLDGDGALGVATSVVYRFGSGVPMAWIGTSEQAPTPGLLPLGTELLHPVRYLDPRTGGPAERMKELRYMVKTRWLTMAELAQTVTAEESERQAFPDRLDPVIGDFDTGVANGRGWRLSGLIEDRDGTLRPQTKTELAACIGCHGGIGRGVDSVFSYGRKQRWGVGSTASPVRGDGVEEHEQWKTVAGGRFFGEGPGDARSMNKAYRTLVDSQRYDLGREPVWGLDEKAMWREVPPQQPTGIRTVVKPAWIQNGR